MVLLRRLLGEVLRRHRNRQSRTLRDVSAAAGVSLGYLSEVERGRKEASSELLTAICDALGISLAEVLHEVSEDLAREDRRRRLAPVGFAGTLTPPRITVPAAHGRPVAGVAPLAPTRSPGRPDRTGPAPERSRPRPPAPVTSSQARTSLSAVPTSLPWPSVSVHPAPSSALPVVAA
jgi:transcriptional regulator with XRE-family HTH domain